MHDTELPQKIEIVAQRAFGELRIHCIANIGKGLTSAVAQGMQYSALTIRQVVADSMRWNVC